MKYSIEGGSLPAVIISLDPGEKIISENGGRTWSRGNVLTETTSNGGVGKMLGRMVTGESAFMSTYTAQGPCEICFTSSFPGRIVAMELQPGQTIIAQKTAFLAASFGVEVGVHVNKNLGAGVAGGEGFLMQRITGPGIAFFEIDGYCKQYDLQPGEQLVCDTGVLALMESSVTMTVQKVKGLKNMLLGGEGLFDTVLTGPGKVYLQTMTAASLAGLLAPFIVQKK
jgi:uncharacterized protein (TIGR00266 family)